MHLIDIFELAFYSLWTNKSRTILTILGVSIGIAAIIFLVSLGYGLRNLTISKITSVKALSTLDATSNNSDILHVNDVMVSKIKKITDVKNVSPNLMLSGQAQLGKTMTDVTISAIPAKYLDLEDVRLVSGSLFKKDNDKKILISAATASALSFASNNDAIGKTLTIKMYVTKSDLKEVEYIVSGVLKGQEESLVYLPLGSINVADPVYSTIKIEVNDRSKVSSVRKNIEKNFGLTVSSVGDTILKIDRVFNITQLILFALGAIGLLVASIGMFNTMTISLLEKIREIGIMKALGATSSDISKLFITESIIIGFMGGLTGILLGFLAGKLTNMVVNILARSAGGEAEKIFATPIVLIFAIVMVSFLIGIVAGFYPARRGAKVNPLEAIRYE